MATSVGRLIQPFVQVLWNDVDLTAYDPTPAVDSFPTQPIISNPVIELGMDHAAGKLEFEVSPHPIAAEAIFKLKVEFPDKPIKVRVGYELGSYFETFYQFIGLSISTGSDSAIKVVAVGLPKGPWTDNRISYTMGSEISLDRFPDFLKSKCGQGCRDIKFKFVGKFEKDAKGKKVKRNDIARPPHAIINEVMAANGALVSISDSVIDGSIIFHYPFNLVGESVDEELKLNLKQAKTVVGKRNLFLLGPGSFSTFNRTQTFNLSQTSLFRGNSSPNSTNREQNNPEVVEGNQPAQTNSANSSNTTGGTTGPTNPGHAGSGMKYDPFFNLVPADTGKNYDQGFTMFTLEENKAIVERARRVTTECNVECFMTPYLVGLKPRDIIAIPSLRFPVEQEQVEGEQGENKKEEIFIEDWIVDKVTYTQDSNGAILVGISGLRPYTGDENMMDEETLKQVREVVKGLGNLDAWNNLYWNIDVSEDEGETEGNETEAADSLVVESLPLFD